jgi:hypothetical protein
MGLCSYEVEKSIQQKCYFVHYYYFYFYSYLLGITGVPEVTKRKSVSLHRTGHNQSTVNS